MANITLFAQVIRLIPREIIQRLVKKHDTDKNTKGFNSWSHLVTMIFSQFSGSVSLRQISEGLQSATGNLNHLGLSRAPSKSNSSYQNANRTSQFFEDVFYALFQYLGQHGGLKQMKKTPEGESLSIGLHPNVSLPRGDCCKSQQSPHLMPRLSLMCSS